MEGQVTSRGCSRGFIILVLWHGWQFVLSQHRAGSPINFPIDEEIVRQWMYHAREDAPRSSAFLELFGGTDFIRDDPSTFWTIPSHFFTWWKNNVERKSKFSSLAKDAMADVDYAVDPKR